MTTFGLTPDGFNKKTLQDIKEDIQDDLRDTISPSLNFLDSSRFGQLIGVFSDKLREMWDVAEADYRSRHPDAASGDALDNVASITGAIRLEATKSTVTLDQLFLDNGTTIPVGSIVSVGSGTDAVRFVTLVEVSNTTGAVGTFSTTAEAESTGENAGYAGTIDTIVTSVTGWSDQAAITAATAETYALDGTSLTLKVDRGSVQTVNFAAGNPWSATDVVNEVVANTTGVAGEVQVNKPRLSSTKNGTGSAIEITGGTANTILLFDTAEVKGFNSSDAAVGRAVETDPEFRLRRTSLLRQTGKATVEAIRANLLAIVDTIQALVIENVELTVSPEGLPGKSFESVVQGATDAEIAATIWDTKPAGIETHGDTTVVVTDTMGFTHDIKFSRPADIRLYINTSITVDSSIYPADGDDQVKAALAAKGAELQVGEDIVALQFKCVPLEITGVVDVTAFTIDVVTPPVNTGNIVIAFNELGSVDTADVNVTSS
jgi:hypothetical protein